MSRLFNVNVLKTIVNDTLINTTNVSKTYINTISTENKTQVDINQEINLNIGEANCTNFKVSNKAENNVKAVSKISSKQMSQLTTKIMTQMERDLEKVLKQKANALRRRGLGIRLFDVNVTEDTTNIMNDISSFIEDTVRNTVNNILSITTDNKQVINLNIGKLEGTDCEVGNELIVNTLAEAITDSIAESMLDNENITDILTKYSVETDQEAGSDPADIISSFGDLIGNVFGAIFGPFQFVGIAIMIVIFIIIIMMFIPKGKGGKRKGAGASKAPAKKA